MKNRYTANTLEELLKMADEVTETPETWELNFHKSQTLHRNRYVSLEIKAGKKVISKTPHRNSMGRYYLGN